MFFFLDTGLRRCDVNFFSTKPCKPIKQAVTPAQAGVQSFKRLKAGAARD